MQYATLTDEANGLTIDGLKALRERDAAQAALDRGKTDGLPGPDVERLAWLLWDADQRLARVRKEIEEFYRR